jgi:hypothetical protein
MTHQWKPEGVAAQAARFAELMALPEDLWNFPSA